MTEFHSSSQDLPNVPDNITLAQFILDYQHDIQPSRLDVPPFVDDITGKGVSLDQVLGNQFPPLL